MCKRPSQYLQRHAEYHRQRTRANQHKKIKAVIYQDKALTRTFVQMIKIDGFLFTLFVFLLCGISSCKTAKKGEENAATATEIKKPQYSADSAFGFVEKQVAFGNRIPGTASHQACRDYLVQKLSAYCDTVILQSTTVKLFDGKTVPCYNIIGTFNADAARRMLLSAHWDTRPYADQDIQDKTKAIAGANDGGSGVGVLLEVARQLRMQRPEYGIDIIFFDVEDWGQPEFSMLPPSENSYCLGSQYWSRNTHIRGYTAQQGILLDMVGGKGATFTLEGTSMRYAPEFMQKVWTLAAELGHGNSFVKTETPPIIDDHYYINTILGIPTIDIIHHDASTPSGFPHYWHTHNDDMSNVDKTSLSAVGETILAVIYNL